MAYTAYRFFRAIRSLCFPITAIVGFSCLLTFIFILYQPNPGPGIKQRLGWQSWEVVTMYDNEAHSNSTAASGNATPENPTGSNEHVQEGVDWWNVTSTQPAVDLSSLPLDVWAPLMPHDTGLSEIQVVRCLVDPRTVGDACDPDSTSGQDAINGKWVRVERNLNLEASYFGGFLNVYYRRTRRQDIPLINDIRLLPKGEEPSPTGGWTKILLSLRSGQFRTEPLFLWYHTGPPSSQLTAEQRANLITEIDVLYGDDTPWYGFEKLEPATLVGRPGHTTDTWITMRRGVKQPPRAPPLHFSHSGHFKILQVADLHYSVSQGACRDVTLPGDDRCDRGSDNMTSTLLASILDKEKPDLVVFSGDQLNGQTTSWDPKSILAKISRHLTSRQIPWAAVFGNHDSEDGASREEQIALMQGLPYSLVERGPKDIHGVGNYVLKVKSADPSRMHLLTLYFLDSGSYSQGTLDWFGWFTPTAYDWIRQDQIDWFLQESASIKPIERPFTPDGGKDFGKLWRRQQPDIQLIPTTHKLAKPNAMMFFHMPLPESSSPADTDPRTGKKLDTGTHGLEPTGNAKGSDGFFEKGLLQAMESEHANSKGVIEVKVVANGHSHLTDNCRRVKGIWLCFAGGGSYSAYGRVGFDRRFRVYEISDYGETIRTWKRTEHDEVIDDMMLAGKGAPPLSV